MKKLHIAGIIISLLIASLVSTHSALAAPISPASTGCTISNLMTTISGTGTTVSGQYFYDDDTLIITANHPVNFHITGGFGTNYTASNVTSTIFNIPHTGTYTFSITPVGGQTTALTLNCHPTPISGGCIVSNDYFTGSVTLGLNYNKGERMHITSNIGVNIVITGPASVTYLNVTNRTLTFPLTGNYVIKITTSAPRMTAHGEVTCTQPRYRRF